MKNKVKNYGFWTGISAAVILLLQSLGRAFGFSFDETIVNDIIMSVCEILIVFGIVTNYPSKRVEDDNVIVEPLEDVEKTSTEDVSQKTDDTKKRE